MGHKNARISVLILILSQYALIVFLYVQNIAEFPIFLTIASIPFLTKLVPVYLKATPEQPPEDYPPNVWPLWYSAHAFVHCRKFGALYIGGLLGSLWV